MVKLNDDMGKRVADLESQVAALTKAVNELQAGFGTVAQTSDAVEKKIPRKLSAQGGASEEILSWVDKSYILSRVATTSFIVAVALALRTAADSAALSSACSPLWG